MATSRYPNSDVLNSLCSMIALFFVLFACAELCGASTVVDVYRLIQYDLAGAPFGSRFATLNHHAVSSLNAANADLSRTVIIIPIRELDVSVLKDYISRRELLGGLLFLLPLIFNYEDRDNKEDAHNSENDTKRKLMDLERLLMHANIAYPIYFAFEGDNIEAVLADVKRNDATGQPATATTGGYMLVVSTL